MKTCGTWKAHFGEKFTGRETTRDERLRIICLREDVYMKWTEKVQVKLQYNLVWMLKLPYFTVERIITGKWIKGGDYVVLTVSVPISNQMGSNFWKVL